MLTQHNRSDIDRPAESLRACVHDLRNLFAIVASAKSLLERPLDDRKKRVILEGLARVAIEGKIVTDALLGGTRDEDAVCSDASAELRSVGAIIETMAHPGLNIEMVVEDDASWILMAPAEFRAVVLELATNAVAAGATRTRIRAARRGSRLWIAVADNGSGFAVQSTLAANANARGLHGTGLQRLKAAAASAGGQVKIRSKADAGSVVAMILPIVGPASPQFRIDCRRADRSETKEPSRGQRSTIQTQPNRPSHPARCSTTGPRTGYARAAGDRAAFAEHR